MNSNRKKIQKILLPSLKWFEVEELPSLGFIQIESIGSENMYFQYKTKDGEIREGFVKLP